MDQLEEKLARIYARFDLGHTAADLTAPGAMKRLKENDRLQLEHSQPKYLVYGDGDGDGANGEVVKRLTDGGETAQQLEAVTNDMSLVKVGPRQLARRPERPTPYVTDIGVEPSRRTRALRGTEPEPEGEVTENRYRDMDNVD